MDRIRNAGRALLYIALGLVLTFLVASVFNTGSWLSLYKDDYDFRPGPRFGSRLMASMPTQKDGCLVIGSSTAREGLDPAVLQAALRDVKVTNAATTGGSVTVHETQAAIIDRYNLHYRCIVMPLHPWLLYDSRIAWPDIFDYDEYVALLRPTDIARLSFFQWDALLHKDGVFTPKPLMQMLLPLRKYAFQADRVIRVRMAQAHSYVFDDSLTLANYERYSGELNRSPDSMYGHEAALPRATILSGLNGFRFYDPAIYGQGGSTASLRRAIDLLSRHTDQLIVLHMPDNPLYMKDPNAWSKPALNTILQDNKTRLVYWDCSAGFKPNEFYDHTHLNAQGRKHLSGMAGRALAATIDGVPSKTACKRVF